jgi:hypothetical protein
MSQGFRQNELQEKTQKLLQGPLKHVRAAALAAALLPLASVVATPAAAQNATCGSGGICGFVWNDTNANGVQDAGEPAVEGAVVTLDGTTITSTDADGFYYFLAPSSTTPYEVAVQIPPGTEPSPNDLGGDDTLDSDGVADGIGNSAVSVTLSTLSDANTDFGFFASPVQQPGTGTPGYWKNHPEAWPVASITVGGIVFTRTEAIALLDSVGKDKRTTMFSSLVSAMLNVMILNDGSCVQGTIDDANVWMAEYLPWSEPRVDAASYAWKIGEPLHRLMDNYNNGMLCAPHRD